MDKVLLQSLLLKMLVTAARSGGATNLFQADLPGCKVRLLQLETKQDHQRSAILLLLLLNLVIML